MFDLPKTLLKRSATLQRANDRLKAVWRRRRNPAKISAYLASADAPKLHLGCGSNVLPGWLNADLFSPDSRAIHLDVTAPFPFPDHSFDYVLAEHLIEHIPHHSAWRMLGECYRVLRPGGVLRIGTPDLAKYLALHGPAPSEIEREAIHHLIDNWIRPGFHAAVRYAPPEGVYDPIYVINDIFRNYDHQFIYDYPTLHRMALAAGFARCAPHAAGLSEHPPLCGVETHADPINRHLTLTIEAVKTA